MLEILNVTDKLRDGAMRDETLVICVIAELRYMQRYGAMSSEHDETLVMCVTAKCDFK